MNIKAIGLEDLVEISIGAVINRQKISADVDTSIEHKVITMRSISNSKGKVDLDLVDKIKGDLKIDENYITKKGDVLFKLASPYAAIYIDEETSGLIIPSHFAILRSKNKLLEPKFLQLYISEGFCNKQLAAYSEGSALNIMKMSNLKKLKIKLPNIERQKEIIEINTLFKREYEILEELIKQNSKRNKAVLKECLK